MGDSIEEVPVSAEGEKEKFSMKACFHKKIACMKGKRGRMVFGVILIILILGAGGRFYVEYREQKNADAVKAKAEAFIKEKMIQPGTDFKVVNFGEAGGLYKMVLSVGSQNVEAYVTKDGKKFFPGSVDMDKKEEADTKPTAPAPAKEVTQKQDVPTVELFVMSYCPYGTQAEKGILPAVKALGSKIKFDIKFVSYTMHGKKEFDENLNQYCIQKEEPKKYLGYLECFDKTASGDSVKCMTRFGINRKRIDACVSATDQEFKLTEGFNGADPNAGYPPFNIQKDLNEKYGVQGSPSLVINGQLVDAERDSASMLKVICSGFTKAPAACSTKLSSEAPAPGFGDGTAPSGSSSASCN